MIDEPFHHCPGCGAQQRRFDRYPWYFCQDCLKLAEDHEGRQLVFYNTSLGGGLTWGYADDPDNLDSTASVVTCYILKRKVTVTDARFGGIVAQPTSSMSQPFITGKEQASLTGGDQTKAGRDRLKPWKKKP